MNEFERLIKDGYEENGVIYVDVDDITTFNISEEALKGADRHDKTVILRDAKGHTKKVSSLMFGKNKKNIQLSDGSYLSKDELLVAIQDSIKRLDEGSVVVTKKGQYLDPKGLLEAVTYAAGQLIIGEKTAKVTNQDARLWQVQGAKDPRVFRKGTVWLGNDGIELSSGGYISLEEFSKALNEYLVLTPTKKEKPIPDPIPFPNPEPIPGPKEPTPSPNPEPVPGPKDPVPSPNPEPNPVEPDPTLPPTKEPTPKVKTDEVILGRVTRKYKNRASMWLCIFALVVTLLSGIRIKDNIKTVELPEEVQTKIETMINEEQMHYNVDSLEQKDVLETPEQVAARIARSIQMGEKLETKNGDTYNTNSLFTGSSKTIGEKFTREGKMAGAYEVTGFSITDGKRILGAVENYNQKDIDVNLGNIIDNVCSINNLEYQDLSIAIHLGGNLDSTRLGWININDLLQQKDLTPQVIDQVTEKVGSYKGIENNFNGSTITIDTLNGPTTIKVTDPNGNLLPAGSHVIGSDGKEYVLNDLAIENVQTTKTEYKTETVMKSQEIVDGKKLTWNIKDCDLALAIAPLVGAVGFAVQNKKKNEEAMKNPTFMSFENDADYQKFLKAFLKSQEKYKKKSNFRKTLGRVFIRKEEDILQLLTEEQIQELYNIIKNYRGADFIYSPGDHIEFKNGKILLYTYDDHVQDITDTVMPLIHDIGKDNKVEATGILEGMENEHEFRGR